MYVDSSNINRRQTTGLNHSNHSNYPSRSNHDQQSSLAKIKKITGFLILSFKLLMVVFPILVIAYWFGFINMPKENYISMFRIPVDVDLHSLRFQLKLVACLVDLIPTSIVVMGFHYLIKLFELYSKTIFFTAANVLYIRKIGFNLLWQFAASILIQPFLSIILTFDAPKGGHMISIAMGNPEVTVLLTGIIVILISWVMEEGCKLEEEKSLTV